MTDFEELTDAEVAQRRTDAWLRYHQSLERKEPLDAQKTKLALFKALENEDLIRKGLRRRESQPRGV